MLNFIIIIKVLMADPNILNNCNFKIILKNSKPYNKPTGIDNLFYIIYIID